MDDSYGVINGKWKLMARSLTGMGSYIISPQFQIPARDYNLLQIRMRVSQSYLDRIQIYWNRLTDKNFTFPEENSVFMNISSDSNWHTYIVDLRKCPNWKGTIRQLCLAGLGLDTLIEIDFIRIWGFPQ